MKIIWFDTTKTDLKYYGLNENNVYIGPIIDAAEDESLRNIVMSHFCNNFKILIYNVKSTMIQTIIIEGNSWWRCNWDENTNYKGIYLKLKKMLKERSQEK